ncbi:MAG: NAD(P)(+) transhydrogenase (Re/Si-specific) subunit beta [Deltaproteobacteria bacterium]|nr:NAD(P)(+) transhydrogenase (Re/Si-specific) subunit beta [Deltaproteobacteria bacterium]
MESVLLTIAYLASSVFFILALRGLSNQETARAGNIYGMVGMGLATVATFLAIKGGTPPSYSLLVGALVVGGFIGAVMAARVAMTAMPQMVALLHSFVGAAAVLVGFASFLNPGDHGGSAIFMVEVGVDVAIGAITFTGSVVAFLKLDARISGKPLLLPGRNYLNLAMLVGIVATGVFFGRTEGMSALMWLLAMTAVSGIMGVHLVAAIGGADMPVVVSMLNSYSGWTAAAAGFMLGNDLLIITGALVGSSGAILSYIMCRAMNRSIWNVIFGGFGTPAAASKAGVQEGEVRDIDVENLVGELQAAKEVIIVPGYGMAVARAQHAVYELTSLLRKNGTRVRFGIHPVAGRLPGHMNVLLAEANVPYDIVLEMDEINEDFESTDVVLVIGANDIVNPGAETDPGSPIYGMPVLKVWHARMCVMSKRSRAAGYAGVDNPLFYMENTRMLFGDAQEKVSELVSALKSGR